ncbi:efflux RND transporter periplasmic adaptor subunit [Litoribacter ruber]|uniref:Efflux RND transporter periplasmic adaptor subunit n=1 Tax=Litoribacter ruber TaxID=702568 RepID=A0AAP2CH61_9BACT|nr:MULTISPECIES: efflux RND transporter periplasmic adaptor subunit [Litoribacter]MBS9523614.1 efflux RND transporter periplasmic adaptor subunit [Litoribacter alkaliphilus]MBT0812128.1 efflux RND transporter periplasmic adaptor subunit [Litoribacter ruber]
MNRKTKITLIVVIVLVIAGLFFYPRLEMFQESADPETQAAEGQSSNLPVNVVEIRPERLENNLNLTGSIIANEMVSLRPEISGLVERVNFKEGEYVKKGTPLLYLNDDELKAQAERLNYQKKLFEGQENRQRQLLDREAISQEEYDIVLNQFNTNVADIQLIDAQLRKTVIRAPFDGVLGLRQVSEGSFISSSDMIASIVNIDPIKIEFSIPERYANRVKTGSKVHFSTNASEGESVGTVYAIEPNIDAATRTLKLRAESPNRERRYLPGMFVRVRLNLDVQENALMVPAESIIPELDGYKVFVARDGVVEEARVSIGTRTERKVQVLEGLNEGDLVLTTGVLQVRTGMPVEVTKIN